MLDVIKAESAESEDAEEQEQKPESFFEDADSMTLGEKNKYASKLYRTAKERGLNPSTYTDDTIDWFIIATEKMLRDDGIV